MLLFLPVFGHVEMKSDNLFEWAARLSTRGHKYKLYSWSTSVRHYFYWACCKCMELSAWWSWF